MTYAGKRSRIICATLIVVAAVGAFAFRVPNLDKRPMHTDEAVHTVKAGELIEEGRYIYDPQEYHGPTIYYFAMPFVWLSGAKSLAETNEFTFRIVPVIFGTALVLLLLLVGDGLGRWATVIAAVLTAVSPAMVFYSRYYIQEMLLVFFTFAMMAALWRHSQSRRFAWLLLAGACAGMMHATKETCILTFAALGAAIVAAFLWARWRDGFTLGFQKVFRRQHLVMAAVMAFFISAPLLSGFFRNPRAQLDAWLTYTSYLHRAGGAGIHDHPWYYYLQMLLYTKNAPGPWWSEGLIVALAAVGAVAALLPRPVGDAPPGRARPIAFVRVVAFYTIFLTVIYSAIPYKTPWCMLSFLHGMILLAGFGAAAIIRRTPTIPAKAILVILLSLGAYQLGQQAHRANTRYAADTRNPYVYGHTATDILRVAKRIEEIARVAPEGRDMLIKVITPDCWPLPWYLRGFGRVGYWAEPPDDMDAAIVITSEELDEQVDAGLKQEYQKSYYGLRPEVLIAVHVRQDLWDAFIEERSK
ncbi:MAG: TIGR03663 family protein [Nitrospiraceae bacterium]|nr:TIGR03663 family protein [Nitrospiraceae bacterium]